MGSIQPVTGNDMSATLEFMSEKTVVQAEPQRPDSSTNNLYREDEKTQVLSRYAELVSSRELHHSHVVTDRDVHTSIDGNDGLTKVDVRPPVITQAISGPRINDNLLLVSALPLIHSAMSLVSIGEAIDIATVRTRLISDIDRFENKAIQCFGDQRQITAARYLLCSFIDEIVATSPWGAAHSWGAESLLSYFHNETYGGDGFFKLLESAQRQPQLYLDLLELMYVCLSLGFTGRYKVDSDGATKLESMREVLMTTISKCRAPDNKSFMIGEISPQVTEKRQWRWLAPAVLGVLVLVNALGYLFAAQEVDHQMERLSSYVAAQQGGLKLVTP